MKKDDDDILTPLFSYRTTRLSQEKIYQYLKATRYHAAAPLSHYHVASIVEVELQKDKFFLYTSGVNVELIHNLLSIHSEQTAVTSAIAFSDDKPFSKIWIMAAPADASSEEKHNAAKSCGHCRQIMASLAKPHAEIYVVTLDGHFSKPDTFESQFLPDSFSERDLNTSSSSHSSPLTDRTNPNLTIFNSQKFRPWNILTETRKLTTDEIMKYLKTLSPHIINKKFQTSPITKCIVKCNAGYAVGVLVQDIAFLTTDAILAAIGNAITRFGNKNLRFDEIHLASDSLDPAQLSFTEIELLSQYVHGKTIIHFYDVSNNHVSYIFTECMRARYEYIEQQILERTIRAKL